jgi:hypothetical protein
VNSESLPRRVLARLFGVDLHPSPNFRPPAITGYSVARRVVARLLGVRLREQDSSAIYNYRKHWFDEWLSSIDLDTPGFDMHFRRVFGEGGTKGSWNIGERRQIREAVAAVVEAQRRLTARPEDMGPREQLMHALVTLADQARSLTRGGERVITSTGQLELLVEVKQRILALDVQDELTNAARNLLTEVEAASKLRWQRPGPIIASAAFAVSVALAAIGAVLGSVVVLVCGIGFGITLPLLTAMRYRVPAWQIRAMEDASKIWTHGI